MSNAPDKIFIDEDGDACLSPSGRPMNLVAMPAYNEDTYNLLNPDAWHKMVMAFNHHDELVDLLTRYRNETPIGNQPHMICGEVDTILATIKEASNE